MDIRLIGRGREGRWKERNKNIPLTHQEQNTYSVNELHSFGREKLFFLVLVLKVVKLDG